MGGVDRPQGGGPNWFIALEVPPLPGWSSCLARLPGELRRFAAEDRHLTVAFLAACGEERARQAWRALASLRHAPIEVRPGAWRAMGPPRQPSAYALTLGQGSTGVARLMRQWGARARAAAGLRREEREPLPHITVARPPRRRAPALRAPMQRWMDLTPVPAEAFLLSWIALYGWNPERRSRLFRIVAHRRLDAPESGDVPEPPA